ncbi:MAG: hypothetical protein M0P73_00880 [Syntrophobacterales bacterium]|jgi:hypothetical protein|nr:hypothetical protein [Syntrophobacterales bacterium]
MKPKLTTSMAVIIALSLLWAAWGNAQALPPNFVFNSNVPPGFEQAGIIQAATLNPGGGPNAGGTLTINGITMIVPANTIVQMPANTLTWGQLFDPAVSAPVYDNSIPAQLTPPINHPASQTGLALADVPTGPPRRGPLFPGPFPCFNAIVLGNIDVKNSLGFGPNAYIIGLILPIDQDLGNAGSGFITYIDYEKGRFEANGTLNVPGTGTVIEINDPLGRFGLAHSPDPRWSVDSDNPTVSAGNGYPMGIPKYDPAVQIDPDRPIYNRPLNPPIGDANHDPFLQAGVPFQTFFMPPKAAPNAPGDTTPDPWKQAPFMLGDYVDWSGILAKFNPSAAITPKLPMNQQVYISANTVSSDKLAIFTASGPAALVGPCYLQGPLRRSIIGTGGTPLTVPPDPSLGIIGGVIPVPEPKLNFVAAGWCTDSTNLVDIYAVDIDPVSGAEVPRLLGTVLPLPGEALGKGQKGRFVLQVDKTNFLPPTRVYKFRSRHGTLQLPDQTGLNGAPLPGLLSGQYRYPQFGFQFPDTFPGYPVMPNNLNTLKFLTQGEGGNPSDGPLTPFPPFTP